jgi:hypothetical protein
MKSSALQSCVQHWYRRQEAGECPFEFKHVNTADFRPVKRKGVQDPDSDEEIQLPDLPSSPSSTAPHIQYVLSRSC